MHVKSIRFNRFKRFTDLTLEGLVGDERLVVLTGPNGSGKSAIIEGFNSWRRQYGGWGQPWGETYFTKVLDEETATRLNVSGQHASVSIEFFEELPSTQDARRTSVYVRSAYRHEADFRSNGIRGLTPLTEEPGEDRLNRAEQKVQKNYSLLVGRSVQDLYNIDHSGTTAGEIVDRLVGKVRRVMLDVFDGLVLESIGDPVAGGTFLFTKGLSKNFAFENLSGGERAALDLVLDFALRTDVYGLYAMNLGRARCLVTG